MATGYSIIGRPATVCSTLALSDFMRVPRPAARMTVAERMSARVSCRGLGGSSVRGTRRRAVHRWAVLTIDICCQFTPARTPPHDRVVTGLRVSSIVLWEGTWSVAAPYLQSPAAQPRLAPLLDALRHRRLPLRARRSVRAHPRAGHGNVVAALNLYAAVSGCGSAPHRRARSWRCSSSSVMEVYGTVLYFGSEMLAPLAQRRHRELRAHLGHVLRAQRALARLPGWCSGSSSATTRARGAAASWRRRRPRSAERRPYIVVACPICARTSMAAAGAGPDPRRRADAHRALLRRRRRRALRAWSATTTPRRS